MGIMKWECKKIGHAYRIVAEQDMGDISRIGRCGFEISVIEWNQTICRRFLLERAIRWITLEMARLSRSVS